jgi:hypothetical protein
LHASMAAVITHSPQRITTGSPVEILVNVTGTHDALSAASAEGFFGVFPPYPSPPCCCFTTRRPQQLFLRMHTPHPCKSQRFCYTALTLSHSAIIRITDTAQPSPLPLTLLAPLSPPCNLCSLLLSASFTPPPPPHDRSAASRTMTITVRSGATSQGACGATASISKPSIVLFHTPPPTPHPPSVSSCIGHSNLLARARAQLPPPPPLSPPVAIYLRLVSLFDVLLHARIIAHFVAPGAVCGGGCWCASQKQQQVARCRYSMTPHTSHFTPHTSHVTPHTSHLTPHTSHLSGHCTRTPLCTDRQGDRK